MTKFPNILTQNEICVINIHVVPMVGLQFKVILLNKGENK